MDANRREGKTRTADLRGCTQIIHKEDHYDRYQGKPLVTCAFLLSSLISGVNLRVCYLVFAFIRVQIRGELCVFVVNSISMAPL